VVRVELEERARLLKQRLNIKTAASATAAAAAAADGGVPFSDSEVSGPHRSRPRDGGRKSTSTGSRSGGVEAGLAESPQRGGGGTWNSRAMQSGERSSATGGAGGRHATRSSSSSSCRHDYAPSRRSHTADVHADRNYRRRGT